MSDEAKVIGLDPPADKPIAEYAPRERLGILLLRYRTNAKKTVAESADHIGTTEHVLTEVERHVLTLNAGQLQGLAGLYGVRFEPLLDAAHPNANGGAGADNLESAALTWAIMRTVMDAQGSLATETGLPLNIRSNTLLVGPANRRLARELAGPMRPTAIGDASAVDAATAKAALGFNNYDGQELMVIESPYIAGVEYIFMDLSKPTKPMLLAEFTKFRTLSQLTEASDGVYERDTYSWSIQGDVAPAPMAWQLAHGSVTA